MDFATILGIVIAVGAIALSAWVGEVDVRTIFARYDSFILIFFGSMGATLTSMPLATFWRALLFGTRTAFLAPPQGAADAIGTLVSFAEKARREGLLALENEAGELQDEFMRKGIQLVIDGRETDVIRKILETEATRVHERSAKAEMLFTTLGGFSPTLGIIGTVLGLIAMLKQLGSLGSSGNVAGTIGVATAQAFVATFFGISLANLLWIPLAAKVKERGAEQLLVREIVIEGVLAIQAGDNPRLLEEKLRAFLDPGEEPKEAEPEAQPIGEPAAVPS